MSISQLGEFGLISLINKKFSNLSHSEVEGIGDDCAVIALDSNRSLVVTTDILVEGKHFLLDKISPFELGYKSLAVNISDVAAMGAKPYISFLSLALPSEVNSEWITEFMNGYHSLSTKHNIPLVGGDTTSANSGSLTISVTAMGIIDNKNIKRRSGACLGDLVVVNSLLGDSALALSLILKGENISETLFLAHNMPEPKVIEGQFLGSEIGVTSMMDISDGIASDIEHICSLSNLGAEINIDKLPISNELATICKNRDWAITDFALCGGEDYSLLMTIKEELFSDISERYNATTGDKLYVIGKMTASDSVKYIDNLGEETNLGMGFRHF